MGRAHNSRAGSRAVAMLAGFVAVAAGCDRGGPVHVLPRASKSSAIAITSDDARAVLSVAAADTVAVVDVATQRVVAEVEVGDDPRAVVIHPDDDVAFVANRGDATVSVIEGISGDSPEVVATIAVGAEPTGVALSPTGRSLFVAEWAEGRVARIDTRTRRINGTIEAPRNPFTVAVTNDGDADDSDELILVPEFFGEPVDGEVEGSDRSRRGRVRIYASSDLAPQSPVLFDPIDSGFAPSTAPAGTVTSSTSPNQFYGLAVVGTKFFVTSISASPAGPINFQNNVQPVVYVGDAATSRALSSAEGGTANLARLLRDQFPDPQPKIFLADLVDAAFVGDTVGYFLARGGEVLQRVVYDPAGAGDLIALGSSLNAQIDLNVSPGPGQPRCQTPIGVVTTHSGTHALVNCAATQAIGFVELATQRLAATETVVPISVGVEQRIAEGFHFFFTARGRWSNSGWSDCASCHAEGLTDNITWTFPTGPRQSTSLDGSFTHDGAGPQLQRTFNWTGIFDEVHDFERNVRTVSGGLGAVTISPSNECGTLSKELPFGTLNAMDGFNNLEGSIRFLVNGGGSVTLCGAADDWNKIEQWMQTIRPAGARRFSDADSVVRGRALFGTPSPGANAANCVSCHGGRGWTVSRLFYDPERRIDPDGTGPEPTSFVSVLLANEPFDASSLASRNNHTRHIQAQLVQPGTIAPENQIPIPGAEVSCVIREVGTFGVPGDAAGTDRLEIRNAANAFDLAAGGTSVRAQGAGGYNVPSLYGVALGAPYLHHGGARTLEELFALDAAGAFDARSRWREHLEAGNPNFLAAFPDDAARAQAMRDLIAFLTSIDASSPVLAIPQGADVCPPDDFVP